MFFFAFGSSLSSCNLFKHKRERVACLCKCCFFDGVLVLDGIGEVEKLVIIAAEIRDVSTAILVREFFFGDLDRVRALGIVAKEAAARVFNGGFFKHYAEACLKGVACGQIPRAFDGNNEIFIAHHGLDVGVCLSDLVFDRGEFLRLPEERQNVIGIVNMQVLRGTTRELCVKKPVFPAPKRSWADAAEVGGSWRKPPCRKHRFR